jgi:hypothetical protein
MLTPPFLASNKPDPFSTREAKTRAPNGADERLKVIRRHPGLNSEKIPQSRQGIR